MSRRAEYEAEVRALTTIADARLAGAEAVEAVARDLVARRNALKLQYREDVDVIVLRAIEARKYGNPIGPDADSLFRKYGTWEDVIAACARHAVFGGG